jgi:hypothetical protein
MNQAIWKAIEKRIAGVKSRGDKSIGKEDCRV